MDPVSIPVHTLPLIVSALMPEICFVQGLTDVKGLVGCLQVFSKCAQVQDTVGLANCGISSSVAKDMHKKQGIYGTPAMA